MDYLKYGIEESDYFFCILSDNIEDASKYGACYSDNWIKDEYNYAHRENKEIYGLKLNNIEPSFWKTGCFVDFNNIWSYINNNLYKRKDGI